MMIFLIVFLLPLLVKAILVPIVFSLLRDGRRALERERLSSWEDIPGIAKKALIFLSPLGKEEK
jgi:hypothetical protein